MIYDPYHTIAISLNRNRSYFMIISAENNYTPRAATPRSHSMSASFIFVTVGYYGSYNIAALKTAVAIIHPYSYYHC